MANLKIEFQKPKLTLCNTNYTPLGILTNKTFTSAHNITLTSKVNETPYLTFDMPLGGLIDNNSTELLIKHKNDYFVIKNISMASGDSNSLAVTAEHIACELKGIVVSYFEDLIGETPENMWNTIVANSTMPDAINSRYIFETNIVDTYRYLSGEDEKSVFEHLVDIAEQFEACLLFSTDADGIIHIKLLYGDIDRGKFIRKGKDLKQLNLTFNTESLFTKVTPFGATDDDGIELTIMDLNDGKSYLTNYDYYLAKGMTMEEISANPLCNQECIYRNTDIVDAEDLLRLGQQELKRLSEPVVNGSVEVIDLGVFEGSLYLSPILCEKIIVIDKDINYSISCKITEIEFTYDNPLESKISISNVVKYSSALKELIKTSDAVSEILTNGLNGKPNLNASKVKGLIDGHIAQLKYSMENSITDITDAVILFENRIEGDPMQGALAIGSRGILISRELDITTNQWAWTTAIDAHGLSAQIVNAIEVNASQIKGDTLSSYDNSTWIDLNNGEFNFKDKIKFIDNEFSITLNNGETIDDFVSQYEKDKENMTNDINDVAQEVTNIRDNIDIVISDGVITEAEIVSIEKSIMQLQKEKVDVDSRYLSMVNNSYLDSELKLKLTSSYNGYVKAHSDFVNFIQNIIVDREITEQERADLDTYSSNYNTALATLKTDMDTCLSNIAENNTAYQVENLKTKMDSDFQDVNNRLDAIIDDVGGVVADGIIEETEVLIIQNSIKQLNKEKEDVDMIYNTLYNDSDVPTKNKEDLKTKYDEYNAAHHELITFINAMILDRVATEEEKTTFDNLADVYSTKLASFKNSANIALAMSTKNYTNAQFNILNDEINMRVTSQEVQEMVDNSISESNAYADTLFQDAKNQMDGKIESYYQTTDPSTSWTTAELKTQHTGDIWHDSLNNITYRWSGTAWVKLTDADAEQAKAIASSKAKVFTTTPTTPYKVGDLWVQGSGGDIMECNYARSSGNYVSSDWVKASKYTDDSTANEVKNNLANNYYTITQTDSAIKVSKDSIMLSVSETVDTVKDDISETYATKSLLTQTKSDITADFTEMHDNGYEQGIVRMNKDGIEVSHSGINTSTKMKADGFYIENDNGDTLANLSAESQWSTLNVNSIRANDIINKYIGESVLYVRHSYSGDSEGTNAKPFKNFSELTDYFGTAKYLDKMVTIYIDDDLTTQTYYDDCLEMNGFVGSGGFNLNFSKYLILRWKSNHTIDLRCMNVLVNMYFNNSGKTTNDGAVIDNRNASQGTYTHAMYFYDCKRIMIKDGVRVRSAQWSNDNNAGICSDGSYVYVNYVDTCDSGCGFYCANDGKIVVIDSRGNCTVKPSYLLHGSALYQGMPGQTCLVQMGNSVVQNAHNYTYGTLTGSNSLYISSSSTIPVAPTTETKYMTFNAQDYGYWNELYGSWNANGKTVYQGSWSGYGNCRGVFKFSHVKSYLTNATILSGHTITLQRENAGGSSASQTVYLCGTASTNIGSGSAPTITKSYGAIGTLAWGEKKTFNVPDAVATDLKNGTISNIMFYISGGGNYIKFVGSAVLRIKVRV